MIEDHFRTVFPVKKTDRSISYGDNLLLAGSCFAEHIGKRLEERQFGPVINPSGIIYNPVSLTNGLMRAMEGRSFGEDELEHHAENWISFNHHGKFSHPDKLTCLDGLNKSMEEARVFFKDPGFLVISLGTAWVYERTSNGKVVANCHKRPQGEFTKRILTVDEVVAALATLAEVLKNGRTEARIILTVSPVRHVRDGLENDRLSKSVLRLAVQELVDAFENVYYFPAYELLTDDLRDYRFYDKDMVHPNELAIDYIWKHFKAACIADSAYGLMDDIEKLQAAVSHRPFYPASKSHKQLVEKQFAVIESLERKHHFLDLSAFRNKLNT